MRRLALPPSRDNRASSDEYLQAGTANKIRPESERKTSSDTLCVRRLTRAPIARRRTPTPETRRWPPPPKTAESSTRTASAALVERVRRGRRGAQSGYVVRRPLQVTDVPTGTLALVGDDKPLALARGGEQAPADTDASSLASSSVKESSSSHPLPSAEGQHSADSATTSLVTVAFSGSMLYVAPAPTVSRNAVPSSGSDAYRRMRARTRGWWRCTRRCSPRARRRTRRR